MLASSSLESTDQDILFVLKQKSLFTFKDCLIHPSYLKISPHDPIGFKACLEYLYLLYESMLKALLAFKNFELYKFDALVGNNSCFLTSYHIYQTAHRFYLDQSFQYDLEEILKTLNYLKSHPCFIEVENFPNKAKTFEDFLEKNELILDCDSSYFYLTCCFLLSLAKENEQDIEKISYTKLHHFFSSSLNKAPSSKLILKLVKHLQRQVTYLGVFNLYEESKKISSQCVWKKYIFPPFAVFDERRRICTPSLYTQKVTFELLKMSHETLVCLEINLIERPKHYKNRFIYFYKVENGVFKKVEPSFIDNNRPILVYAGCRYIDRYEDTDAFIQETKQSFEEKTLEEMLFSHEVTYPQYSKALKLQDIIPDEIELQKELTTLKNNKGYSLEDPSFLCFIHIYPSSVLAVKKASISPFVYLPCL
jgi:hypothetical protein